MTIDIYPARVFVDVLEDQKPQFSICINDRETWEKVCEMSQKDLITKKEWTEKLESGETTYNIVRVLTGAEVNLLFSEFVEFTKKKASEE